MLTPHIPYPLTEGGYVSQFATIEALQKVAEVTLVLKIENENDKLRIDNLVGLLPEIVFEIIDLRIVYASNQSNSFKDTVRKALKYIIFFLKNNNREKTEKAPRQIISDFDLSYIPYFVNLKNKDFTSKVIEVVERIKPDVIQVDMLDYVDLAFLLPPHIKKVFVHHEIRFARLLSAFAILDDKANRFYEKYLIKEITEREKIYLQGYDGIIVFSENDRKILVNELPDMRILNSPFPILENNFTNIEKAKLNITKLVFVGGEGHDPNRAAVEWFINDISKCVNVINKLPLFVVGNWSEPTIEKYKNIHLLTFSGFVDDLIDYCKNAIMIVPVRVGSGIRTKILYAMAQGVPVVSTSIGCEGIDATNNKEILIADTPEEFAIAIERITKNIDFAFELALNAQLLVRKKYSQIKVAKERLDFFDQILN